MSTSAGGFWAKCPGATEMVECRTLEDYNALAARLAEAERVLRVCLSSVERDGRPHVKAMIWAALYPDDTTASATVCRRCNGSGFVPIGDGYSVNPCPDCTGSTVTTVQPDVSP